MRHRSQELKDKAVAMALGLPEGTPVFENGKLIPKGYVVSVLPRDLKNAKCKDPHRCAIAKAIARMQGLDADVSAAIGGRWAYIPMRRKIGRKVMTYIAKMQATADTQRAIKMFDLTRRMPEAGFEFIPLAVSHQTKARRQYAEAYKRKKELGHKVRKYKRLISTNSIRRLHIFRNENGALA